MNQAKEVYWSALAKDTYAELLKYLLDNYPSEIAINFDDKVNDLFDDKVNDLINSLQYFDQLCPPSKVVINYHKCVINKQNSLVYRINNNHIEIVAFIDNRSDFVY
jgi:Txe/YoeB family toxin of Txe-Axe toxin-antitoxin module